MARSYYSDSIPNFKNESESKILGELSLNHTHALEDLQKNAWIRQIKILKDNLQNINEGQIYFEFSIPRMGKRVDNIIIIKDLILVIEFKVGSSSYDAYAMDQVIDYALDLQNFHEGSHTEKIIPILVSTKAPDFQNFFRVSDNLYQTIKANQYNLSEVLTQTLMQGGENPIDIYQWEHSVYKPTPTIVEAAQALYKGHNVKEISRSDSGAINLSRTAYCISHIIDDAKQHNKKTICFVTGVPGAGKTLAGLNIANERMKAHDDEHAVFLSGNGPLVNVLREALTRDEVNTAMEEEGRYVTKREAAQKTHAFIQNIHHFRDDNLNSELPPVERVVVFDEAQRAWNKKQTSSFMSVSHQPKVDRY